MKKPRRIELLRMVNVVLLLLPITVVGGGISKWVDRDGVVHFGDVPPMSLNYQTEAIRSLSGGSGLSAKQLKLAKELGEKETREQESKFRAEKKTANNYREHKKLK